MSLKVLSQHEIGSGVFAERVGSHKWQLFSWVDGKITRRTWPTMRQAREAYYQDNWHSLGWQSTRGGV